MVPADWKEDSALPARVAVQLKADGVRALYIDGRIVTREGAPLDCARHCLDGLRRLEEHFGEPMFFDGEYVEDGGFNATLRAMRKGQGAGVTWLFDALPMREWRANTSLLDQEARLAQLARVIPHAESRNVGMLGHWIMTPLEATRKAAELVDLGYEGIVAKDARSTYSRQRTSSWLRLKAALTLDCVIMDIAGRSLICRAPDGATIRIPAGRARDEQGQPFSARSIGRIVEIRVNPVTGGGYRGATFLRARPDKEKSL